MAQEEYFFDSLESSLENREECDEKNDYVKNDCDAKKMRSRIPVYKQLYRMRNIKRINIDGRALSDTLKQYKVNVNNGNGDNDSDSTTKPSSKKINKKLIDETKNDLLQRENLRKTYLGIFQSKNGFNNEKIPDEIELVSNKSTYGGSTIRSAVSRQSERSIKSEYSGPAWETASMYSNYMVEKMRKNTQARTSVKTENLYIEACNESVNDLNLNDFYSVSEACISNQSDKTKTPKRKLKKFDIDEYRKTKPISRAGSEILPADVKEKTERLKRMQEYGQRASIRNRARVIVKQQSFVT